MGEVKQMDWLTDFDFYLFGEGKHYRIYEKLGAHLTEKDGNPGVYFAVWAPHAQEVSVLGDFNNWDASQSLMTRNQMGIWEVFVPGLKPGEKYKYAIKNFHGDCCFKTDPYGYQQELRPATASIVTDLSYSWQDQSWIEKRSQTNPHDIPISVYEVHLGSWLHSSLENPPENGQAVPVPHKPGARFLTYRELADKLIPYVKEIGYTHIELLPITEHPFDGSWGYQVVGYFAPTSRYGTPEDFMYFIDRCHQEGIGVIVDWVPGHFPKDEHGLALFDGTPLYEYADWRKGEHKGWGTLVFNYEQHEVCNFLIASALFWLEKYHIDGIRVDAVASMLYLDYERKEWVTNAYGGRENLEAVDFLRQLNQAIFQYYPGVLSIAEESTTWEKVSHSTDVGGLGFNFKWNMGWMNDTLSYFLVNPQERSNVHNKLTFSIWYAFSENFMLALSHDEVVHGKGHLWQKMPGDECQKMANLRALFAYMFTHPGKKTLFMGMEFGQTREWNVNADLDWWLLERELHQQLHQLLKDLHQIYHSEPALYSDDFSNEGFEWIDCHDMPRGMITYMRKDKHSDDVLIVVCNFKPNVYQNYWLGVKEPGSYVELINTDDKKYGGSGLVNQSLETRQWNSSPWPHALEINVPALSVMTFKRKK
ncbi:MAG: 1,4-alpha-glucan branching protein GlgB [Xenococcaceae cyanobacterium MO_234.B1]|nr:1,4-alpha-glucan branching protein GlgB [Xenococcaceae cyanobacterium MO_234.B1]